jgi:hypothetical protein
MIRIEIAPTRAPWLLTGVAVAFFAASAFGAAQQQHGGQQGGTGQQQGQRQQPRAQAPQQTSQQQESMARQQAQHMEQMQQRLHQLEQRAERLAGGFGAQQQLGTRERSMLQLSDALRETTRSMRRSMDQLHLNLRDPDLIRDRDMQRDMERLHDRVGRMADQMDESLAIMERLRDRLHQPEPTGTR